MMLYFIRKIIFKRKINEKKIKKFHRILLSLIALFQNVFDVEFEKILFLIWFDFHFFMCKLFLDET